MVAKVFSLTILFSVWFASVFTAPEQTGKRGLAWASIEAKDIALFNSSLFITWDYNWSPNKGDPMNVSGLEFTPMIWNGVDIDQFAGKVQQEQAKIALAYNEPDLASQANMDPSTAAPSVDSILRTSTIKWHPTRFTCSHSKWCMVVKRILSSLQW